MFFPPVPLIRKRMIMKKLRMCGAFSPETARTPEEAGLKCSPFVRQCGIIEVYQSEI